MRADLISRTVSVTRLTTVVLIALSVVACKTEKDPDQPTVLGIPPATAYLGVEYYYNFGAFGGEDILDYSLTNAPSWLALEDINNKARQGVIMRGVPGLSGGNLGDADLGREEDINLVTTDGRMAGVQPFDITVKYNPLSLEADSYTEGEILTLDESRREHCAQPDLATAGEHSFTINEYNDDGSVSTTANITIPTRPIAVKVILDQPSVTRVAVAFELASEYDASNCDPGFSAPHQRCDSSDANAGDAIIGQDLVAFGSGSDGLLENLDYITYQQDEEGVFTGGVVTFEPGITECYIRLEVADDSFPEPSESARLRLTEVRSGLAGLGESNNGVRANIVVDDDEPVLTLETTIGGDRDTMNVGEVREYAAILTGDRESEIRAKLGHSEDSTARLGTEFVTERWENGSWVESDELVFPVDVNEVPFRIRVPAGTYTNLALDDRFILLGLNESYQAGRENFARAADENLLRVSLNELTAPLVLNPSDGFVPTDLALAHSGRTFVAGYDSLDNDRVLVRIYDQKGTQSQEIAVSGAGDSLVQPFPAITTVQRKVSEGTTKVDRFEFAVAYDTDAPVAGTSAMGGQDILISRYWYDSASNGGEYVKSWTTRTGTANDDIVRSVAMNAENGYVLIAGETDGAWPEQVPAGGVDSFLQRIDVEVDGSNEIPKVAWTRQIGSPEDDSVAGGSALPLSPILFGSAQGSVNGETVIGGVDAFFYGASGSIGDVNVYQVGTEGDERVTEGTHANNILWLIGNGDGAYSVVENGDEDNTLERNQLTSPAGFLLGYSTDGVVSRAYTLNDANDQAGDRFAALSEFGSDMVVAGASDGNFSGEAIVTGQEQGVVARVSLVKDDETQEESPFKNEWRFQLNADDSEIVVLDNYRDDEILALTRHGQEWLLLVLSPEGRLLTSLN
ncbi:hypothetical protein BKP64_06645 [Marinobacter salinus]|uniref:Uncharacterized protein n=1 Tax=Marinobacter salinus TaxID=1874317 RepID=A0A1D9GJQ4_9GAMM|nr:hypothetical protein [Marinobacter salinus]AOY87872.1 hypothetical protein BKP64_06645 [Marinobacter salinus]